MFSSDDAPPFRVPRGKESTKPALRPAHFFLTAPRPHMKLQPAAEEKTTHDTGYLP